MNELLLFWLATGVFFLMIEMFTGTLYGLSVSLAGFLLAAYVGITGETHFGLVQAAILAVSSAVFCFFFPKWFAPKSPDFKVGLERSIGETFVLHGSRGEYRIKIDGVDYLVHDSCVTQEFDDGKKVTLVGQKNGLVQVTIL